ncbi:MAG: hypothetical protein ABIH23_04120 [bacterium]
MTRIEQIQDELRQLPLDELIEVVDFVVSLQEQLMAEPHRVKQCPLREHPAFGSWRGRGIDALQYQQNLRSEWDKCA